MLIRIVGAMLMPTSGGFGWPAGRAGIKPLPAFGGGFWPPYGVAGSETTSGGKLPLKSPDPAKIVVRFPEYKKPAYTN